MGGVAPYLLRGDWNLIGAVWTPDIDDFRSHFRGVDRAQQPYTYYLGKSTLLDLVVGLERLILDITEI